MSSKVVTIVGMGAGNGIAQARRFGKEGFTIAMIARNNNNKLKQYQKTLSREKVESYYYLADVADRKDLKSSLAYIHESLGPTEVLIYNAFTAQQINLLNVSQEALIHDYVTNVLGAISAVQAVRQTMEMAGGGKIFLTGGGFAFEPEPAFGSLAMGKAALRNLAFSLYKQLKPMGIHVATVTIKGTISPEDEKYHPATIAEQYWALYQQQGYDTEPEIIY